MPAMKATPQEISAYLDDMAAGLKAGPAGTPEFRQAVHESQEKRKRPPSHFVDAAAFALGEITEPGEHLIKRDPHDAPWLSVLPGWRL